MKLYIINDVKDHYVSIFSKVVRIQREEDQNKKFCINKIDDEKNIL